MRKEALYEKKKNAYVYEKYGDILNIFYNNDFLPVLYRGIFNISI